MHSIACMTGLGLSGSTSQSLVCHQQTDSADILPEVDEFTAAFAVAKQLREH